MQMQSLRRELSAGLRPLHETFIALIRLFGSRGHATRGLEILGAMEKLKFDIQKAWLVLVGRILICWLDLEIHLPQSSLRIFLFEFRGASP